MSAAYDRNEVIAIAMSALRIADLDWPADLQPGHDYQLAGNAHEAWLSAYPCPEWASEFNLVDDDGKHTALWGIVERVLRELSEDERQAA